ncbi:MAG: hypothetical protein ACOC6A_00865 [Chloroflexota bacterium]
MGVGDPTAPRPFAVLRMTADAQGVKARGQVGSCYSRCEVVEVRCGTVGRVVFSAAGGHACRS